MNTFPEKRARLRSVKKTCRWHVFSSDRSGYAARREPRGTGDEILRCAQNDRTGDALRGTGDGRSRAPPLRFYMSAEGDAARRITKGFMARNVGATFMVLYGTGDARETVQNGDAKKPRHQGDAAAFYLFSQKRPRLATPRSSVEELRRLLVIRQE
jgi:hypothetical protein